MAGYRSLREVVAWLLPWGSATANAGGSNIGAIRRMERWRFRGSGGQRRAAVATGRHGGEATTSVTETGPAPIGPERDPW